MGESEQRTDQQASSPEPTTTTEDEVEDERPSPGAHFVHPDGRIERIRPGCYQIDDDGSAIPITPVLRLVEKIPWDKAIAALENFGKTRAGERKFTGVGRVLLAAAIVGCATALAVLGKIEGQAIVGFLGAAIGYVLARGTSQRS